MARCSRVLRAPFARLRTRGSRFFTAAATVTGLARVSAAVTDELARVQYQPLLRNQIDFERFRPRMILYEHKHLRRETRRHGGSLLTAQGYQLTKHLSNTLAYLP